MRSIPSCARFSDGEGYNSLFRFCVDALHLSESAAYSRIQAARASHEFPRVLDDLVSGAINLTTVGLLAPHLTAVNCATLLNEAQHKRKSHVERMVARLNPRPDAPSVVRKLPPPVSHQEPRVVATPPAPPLPASSPASSSTVAAPPEFLDAVEPHPKLPKPAGIAPLSPHRYKIQITVDHETRELLRQAQDLMRHSLPSGDPAVIISRVLKVLVADLLKKKAAIGAKPRRSTGVADGSRDIPAVVMREVWERDGGRCTHVGPRGRCNDGGFVEYHHVIPYALGGGPTVDNIELRCSAHNRYQARLDGLERGQDTARRV